MNLLEQKIIEKIEREGPITFETFMEMALYEPGLGYYASENTKIGKPGDFYTSHHVHPVFGVMMGRQIHEMWEIMGRPSDFFIVEPGAGQGYMCLDIMSYFVKKRISSSFTYAIVERNPFLQKKQMNLLREYEDRVKWVPDLQKLRNIKGCVISNELLDSFPVHIVIMEDDLKEVYVTHDDQKLVEIKGHPTTEALFRYLDEFNLGLPRGYRTEINLKIRDWLKMVNETLSEGFIMTIDYGYPAREYYAEERNRGTLLCYYRHQVSEDPYQNIGAQDITAHVNFSSLKKWGEEAGFQTLGFCQQGAFLVSLGIDEVIKELAGNHNDYLFEVAKIKRLIMPGTFGETHKVMIQCKGIETPELRGFSIRNQKDGL
ncbi:MAG: SAM-dependent methyltransferase [Nitrospirota bacterium]